jgi:hypothetical protein
MGGSRVASSYESSIILFSFARYLANLDDASWSKRMMFADYLESIGCTYEGLNTYRIVDASRFAWELLKHADKKRC